MNKFIFSAIAIAAASSTSQAAEGDWLQLDQDIASLSSSVAQGGGIDMGAVVRNSYRDGDTEGGWSFEDVDVWLEGSLEEFDWRVSMDLDTGTAVVEDAWVRWACGENIGITWGQFKNNIVRSAIVDPENLLFIDRSLIGMEFDSWDNGVQVAGDVSGFMWSLAAQNGTDGTGDSLLFGAHVGYHIGNGVTPSEGAMKGGEEFDATIGVGYTDEQDDGVDAILLIDGAFTVGPISGGIELADGGDDTVLSNGTFTGTDGTNPWALMVGYLLADNLELGFRHEDRDNDADETRSTFGLNWYLHGHNAKWQINYIDDDALPDQVIAVGLTVGKSR